MQSLEFDLNLDEDCFDKLFVEYNPNLDYKMINLDHEVMVPSYKALDEGHLSKSGFISEIVHSISKILKSSLDSDNYKFDNAVMMSNVTLSKINIWNNFENIELWSIKYDADSDAFDVEFYTLKKIKSKFFILMVEILYDDGIILFAFIIFYQLL